jgi:two-component system invasion response regulator UvrY
LAWRYQGKSKKMIKIIIADDHAIVREGLKQIISDVSDMVVTGEAASGHEVIDKIHKNNYDVVVLDISMPGANVLDVIKEIKRQRPDLPILVLSIHPEEQYAMRVLKAGVSGYLTKKSAPDELITAIRKVSKQKKYISTSLAELMVSGLSKNYKNQPHEVLSDREHQIMCLIASGMSAKEIAEKLGLSGKTVSTYRSRVLRKMNMKNNTEFTHYAIKHKLVV